MALRFQQKLVVPTAARPLVQRGQLLSRLEHAISTKQVVSIFAPGGWGKTTALAQWAARATKPVIWYTLDESDRDPYQFLDYLLSALTLVVPSAAELMDQLHGATAQDLRTVFHATALAISNSPEPFALILDDFHVVDEQLDANVPNTSLIIDLVATLAHYAPHCTLVLASRTVPAFRGLARLLAQGRAAVFDYCALQWSADEAQQLASVRYGALLPNEQVEQLVTQVDGWVTGIVLSLSQTIEGIGEPRLGPADDANNVFAFLVEQIVAPLPPDLQAFLEDTSVLHDLSPQFCDRLRNRQDSRQFLEAVQRHSLFVSNRDGWLNFHSLFRDFLRNCLARDPQRERMLLLRAGDLYRDEDELERALDCYLTADATDQATDLLLETASRWRKGARQVTLLACFERFRQYQALPPALLLAQARVYSDISMWDRAIAVLRLIETMALVDVETRYEAHIILAEIQTLQHDKEAAQLTLQSLPQVDQLSPRLQLFYHLTVGRLTVLDGSAAQAIQAFEQAQLVATKLPPDPETLAYIHDHLGWAYGLMKEYQRAIQHLQRADVCWQMSGNNGRRAVTLNNLGSLATTIGRYREARDAFETGRDLAHRTGRARVEISIGYSLAELELCEANFEGALSRFHHVYMR
jgi:ATP/maltotriose-dependent transcriptional regulator MalT